jgi:rRNA-processing protein EBP2
MPKFKLKNALDNEKGRNIKLEKQRKQEKEAKKRKERTKSQAAEEDGTTEDGGVPVPLDEVEVKVNGYAKKSKNAKKAHETTVAADPEWETDGSDDDEGSDDEDDMPARPAIDLSHLEDSESDISSDEEEMREQERADADEEDDDEDDEDEDEEEDEDEDEEEDEDDIPLSDLDSVASEDKGDIIPHQRLTINNTAALTAAVNRIQLPYSKLAFSEYQVIVTDEPVEITDVEDDLGRELAFYKQTTLPKWSRATSTWARSRRS